MNSICLARLRKEFKEIKAKPVENIRAAPRESNILEWHYVIEGPKKSVYEGGWYHGTLTFPNEYPYKPPSIQMITPNGRFKTCTRLCLSMSDFHPETWNPMWSVGTILMGLYSFMMEETATYGSIETSPAFRRKCAEESLAFNVQNSVFCELFPELVEKYNEEIKRKLEIASAPIGNVTTAISSPPITGNNGLGGGAGGAGDGVTSWAAMIGMLAAIIACTWAILNLL